MTRSPAKNKPKKPTPSMPWGSRTKKVKWKQSESQLLIDLVKRFGEKWTRIEEQIKTKTAKQCMQKYKNLVKVERKGNWAEEEDLLLMQWVEVHGANKWTECARRIDGRCGKQCRERWMNTLDPKVKRGGWTEQEQLEIYRKMQSNWSSWATISKSLDGRTENAIKNYFYSSVRRLKATFLFRFLKFVLFDEEDAGLAGIVFFPEKLKLKILNFSFAGVLENWKIEFDLSEAIFRKSSNETPEVTIIDPEVDALFGKLQKEFLKMNRLTQKIVFYLLRMDSQDEKFGKFLVGIFFKEELKKRFEEEGLSKANKKIKEKYLNIVSKYLEKSEVVSQGDEAEEDPKIKEKNMVIKGDENEESRVNGGQNDSEKKSNKNKKNKKLNKNSDNTPQNPRNFLPPLSPNLDRPVSTTSIIPHYSTNEHNASMIQPLAPANILAPQTNQTNHAQMPIDFPNPERPTFIEDTLNRIPGEFVDFWHLPSPYFQHWDYLRKKVEYYQERLIVFYDMLNVLAQQKMRRRQEFGEPAGYFRGHFHEQYGKNFELGGSFLSKRSSQRFDERDEGEGSRFSSRRRE